MFISKKKLNELEDRITSLETKIEALEKLLEVEVDYSYTAICVLKSPLIEKCRAVLRDLRVIPLESWVVLTRKYTTYESTTLRALLEYLDVYWDSGSEAKPSFKKISKKKKK